MSRKITGLFVLMLFITNSAIACSVLYYLDRKSGKIYTVNNEDFWYDVKAYLQIIPKSKSKLGRLWYGWNDFAQGGVNEAGLFFDGAVTPEQTIPIGYSAPQMNLGDEVLSRCRTVAEALSYLDLHKIALKNAHLMFGDKTGQAVVVEWINGRMTLNRIKDNYLAMTNFLLSDPNQGNYPCTRYSAIEAGLVDLEQKQEPISLRDVGNVIGMATQLLAEDAQKRRGGTLYSTFINLSDMKFVVVSKLNNAAITRLNLTDELAKGHKRKIHLN